jgi:hypothetical protein
LSQVVAKGVRPVWQEESGAQCPEASAPRG